VPCDTGRFTACGRIAAPKIFFLQESESAESCDTDCLPLEEESWPRKCFLHELGLAEPICVVRAKGVADADQALTGAATRDPAQDNVASSVLRDF
jgi:hypothetical protein